MKKKNILDRIKKIISDNNLSNSEFAEKIGIPKSSVTHLLSERNNPSLDVIIKISETFEHISTDYLIFGYENDTETPSEGLNNLFNNLKTLSLVVSVFNDIASANIGCFRYSFILSVISISLE